MVSAFTPNAKNHEGLGPLASRLVHANDMPWEPIRYPGCHVKTLMVDKKSGLLTVLLKMDPGAELPDHEHVMLEQTFMSKVDWSTRMDQKRACPAVPASLSGDRRVAVIRRGPRKAV
jgi:hypothetical protein